MLKESVHYVNKHIMFVKSEHPEVDDDILKAALIYRFLCEFYMMKNITIKEILNRRPYIGLTGSGENSVKTNCETLRIDSILHDAFGRYYVDHQNGGGYTYAWWNAPFWMKRNQFCGQVTGIIYCLFNKINL